MARPRKAYRPRLARIPMMPELRDQFGMQMHVAIACLATKPDADLFDGLARIFNVVQMAIRNDVRRSNDARIINGGALAMQQVMPKVDAGIPLAQHEIAQIKLGVVTIDNIMGKIDVTALYQAMRKLGIARGSE